MMNIQSQEEWKTSGRQDQIKPSPEHMTAKELKIYSKGTILKPMSGKYQLIAGKLIRNFLGNIIIKKKL